MATIASGNRGKSCAAVEIHRWIDDGHGGIFRKVVSLNSAGEFVAVCAASLDLFPRSLAHQLPIFVYPSVCAAFLDLSWKFLANCQFVVSHELLKSHQLPTLQSCCANHLSSTNQVS